MTVKQNTDGKNNFSDQSKQTLINNYHYYEYRENIPSLLIFYAFVKGFL